MKEPLTVDLKYLIEDYNKYFENSDLPDLSTSKGRKQAQRAFDDIISRRRGNNYASSKSYVNQLKNDNYIDKAIRLYGKLITTNDLDETERKFLSGALQVKEVRNHITNVFSKPSEPPFDSIFTNVRRDLDSKNIQDPQTLNHPKLIIKDLNLSSKIDSSKQDYISQLNNKKNKTSRKKSSSLDTKEYFPEKAMEYDASWMEVPNMQANSTRTTMGVYINQKQQDIRNERSRRMNSYLPTDDLDQEEKRLNAIANKYYQGHNENDWTSLTKDDYRFIALNSKNKGTLGVEYRKKALKDMQKRVKEGKMSEQEYLQILNYWKQHNLTLGTDTYTKDEYKNLFN